MLVVVFSHLCDVCNKTTKKDDKQSRCSLSFFARTKQEKKMMMTQ
jgi:hypothetical protein